MGTVPVLFSKIFTLLCSALMGFLSVKGGSVKSRDSAVISALCFDWVIPLSLLGSFLSGYDPETARDFGAGCVFAAVALALSVGITLVLGKALRLRVRAVRQRITAGATG